MTEEQPLALTVPDAARKLGVGRNTLYNAVKRKEFPHIRIGRRLLIPMSTLERFLGGPDSTPVRNQSTTERKSN